MQAVLEEGIALVTRVNGAERAAQMVHDLHAPHCHHEACEAARFHKGIRPAPGHPMAPSVEAAAGVVARALLLGSAVGDDRENEHALASHSWRALLAKFQGQLKRDNLGGRRGLRVSRIEQHCLCDAAEIRLVARRGVAFPHIGWAASAADPAAAVR